MTSLHFFKSSVKSMGTVCEFALYANKKHGNYLLQLAQRRLRQIEEKYTRYKGDSVTSRINASAGSGHVFTIDPETFALLQHADALYRQSGGCFDITSGVLRKAWNFSQNQLPDPSLINSLLSKIGWDKVQLDSCQITLPINGMEIDFGGFVKEYAADQVAEILRQEGVDHGLVNLGGDMVVLGPHADGSPWVIGVQHPREQGVAITKLNMSHGALATSGDYERFILVDGVRYCHILNAKTGFPIQPAFASATIVANQCLLAGSFSTLALMCKEINSDWFERAGLPYLLVDTSLNIQSNLSKSSAFGYSLFG